MEGKQGDFHRFQAVANHRRQPPGFKELVLRRIPARAMHLAGLRSGEIDIRQVFGNYLAQARKAALRIHATPNAALYRVVLSGQKTPDHPDYCPQCPWIGDVGAPQGLENACKPRLALNLSVNKQAIIDGLWKGTGSAMPFIHWDYPFNQGYSPEWTIPPYDPACARQLLSEAGSSKKV